MYVLVVTVNLKSERRDEFVSAALANGGRAVREEPGCLRYDILQDAKDPNRIYFYEVYRDRDAYKAHANNPDFVRWNESVKDFFTQPTQVSRATNLFPPDESWLERR